MQQKINFRMIFLTILAVLTTMVSITYVYYSLFQKQIRDDLRLEARLLAEAGFEKLIGNEWAIEEEEIRITWISEDGEVLFDNDVAADNLGNHLNRPEVKAALENGFGESVRESDTMKLKTYYHALRLENNTIIRVSKDASSYLNLFISTLPVAFTIIILVIILCITISHYLTRQLMEPIREMAENMDQISHGSSYKELDPFIDRIREQHDDILSSAKARQEFTANVSHELKTPIAAISG
ncbi:MAG: two-component sensor histidine kinase, partial [Clostridiales bacterium]|nr:two-component sensor histidine kinase [Candidatus Blautia equi]